MGKSNECGRGLVEIDGGSSTREPLCRTVRREEGEGGWKGREGQAMRRKAHVANQLPAGEITFSAGREL